MKIPQLIISDTPTNFAITSTTGYIQTTLQNTCDNYDLVEAVIEYENSGIGLCAYSFTRKKGDTDANGYLCFGFMDRTVVQYCLRLKGTTMIVNGAITWGVIRKLTINYYNYVEIAQNILETKIITESSQLATIWSQQVEESKKSNTLLQTISDSVSAINTKYQLLIDEIKKIPENIELLNDAIVKHSENIQEIENKRFGFYDSQEILNHLQIVDETKFNELDAMNNKKGVLEYYANRTP